MSIKQPELTPTSEKIDRLIQRINSGDIRIPAFQRSYVWKQNQIIELLDSINDNYPIGSVLLWYTKERLKHTRNIAGYKIPDSEMDYPLNYVLDGQQRLSSIYAVFSDKTEQDRSTDNYNPNLDLFEIHYDFQYKTFVPSTEIDALSKSVIHLKNLINTSKLIPALSELDTKYHNDATELCSRFLNYEIPVVTIKHRSKEEVGIIFERINNTGTKLSTLDLMTAWTWTDDFHLLESTHELIERLEAKGFGHVPNQIILQSLSGMIQNDSTTQAVLKLDGKIVRQQWKNYTAAVKKAIDFLSTGLNCVHQDFLPAIQQLVGIIKFFSIPGKIKAKELSWLKNWFWRTAFSNRYVTGTTTQKMNYDIYNMVQFRAGNNGGLETYPTTVNQSQLINTNFSKSNYLTRAFLLMMAQRNPIDLIKNSPIDLGKALSEYNRKEFHHVFPNAYLKSQGLESDAINNVLNFCFLPADSNKTISKREPKDYFFKEIPSKEFDGIMYSNLLPNVKSIYKSNDYERFIVARSELVLEYLRELVHFDD